MRRIVLPIVMAAALAGRAGAQSADSIARAADELARATAAQHHALALEASRRSWPRPAARWEDSLRFGRRIRVQAASRSPADSAAARREGVFISLTRDTVIYRPEGVDSVLAVSLRDVRGLWVGGPRLTRAQNAAGGALLGAVVGAAVVGLTLERDVRDPSFGPPRGGQLARASLVGAGVGLLVGLAAGGVEVWHRVWPTEGRE